MLELSRIEQRKARRKHRCELCGKPIFRGNEYINESQKYDGMFHSYKRHIHCDALLDAFFESDWYDGSEYSVDEVNDWLSAQCNILFQHGKCSEDDYYNKCGKERCYECPLIFEKALTPEIRRAAEQSARDNTQQKDID